MSSLSSTTSSAVTLSNIFTGAAIAIGALVFLLTLNVVMAEHDSWRAHTAATRRLQMISALIPEWRDSFNANTAAALGAISLPLIATFCAFVVFKAAQVL
jgi:hypothetical protein